MISKQSFTKEHLEKCIKDYPYVDPVKLETTIFAFGLLDELIRCGLPLIFKGGTSLLLLLDIPKRVSTDIDVVVPPNTDFDSIFNKVKERFPFYEGEERGKTPSKAFRHFYFMFKGPISNKECRINLDVAFEDNPYPKTIEKELSLPMLIITGKKTYIQIPTHESILGDKLTAFAPSTIGVNPFMTSLGKPIDNRLQVMKQFYDIARLYDCIKDTEEILNSYRACQRFENQFRNTNYSLKDTLLDSFNHAAEIASMGLWNKKSEFYKNVARVGIQGIRTNIFDGRYNQIDASNDASKIMHLIACLLTNSDFNSNDSFDYSGDLLKCFKSVNDSKAFSLIRSSLSLLSKVKII